MDTYDVVVVGGGPAGEVVADRTVRSGLTAVVVEAEAVGGRAADRSVGGGRQAVTAALDPAHVLARRDRSTGRGDDTGQADWLEGAGIALVRLAGERRVEVTGADGTVRTLRARHAVVVCTGKSPPFRRSKGSTGSVCGPAGRPPRPTRCPSGSSSSAGEWWPARWPPHGARQAPPSLCWSATKPC